MTLYALHTLRNIYFHKKKTFFFFVKIVWKCQKWCAIFCFYEAWGMQVTWYRTSYIVHITFLFLNVCQLNKKLMKTFFFLIGRATIMIKQANKSNIIQDITQVSSNIAQPVNRSIHSNDKNPPLHSIQVSLCTQPTQLLPVVPTLSSLGSRAACNITTSRWLAAPQAAWVVHQGSHSSSNSNSSSSSNSKCWNLAQPKAQVVPRQHHPTTQPALVSLHPLPMSKCKRTQALWWKEEAMVKSIIIQEIHRCHSRPQPQRRHLPSTRVRMPRQWLAQIPIGTMSSTTWGSSMDSNQVPVLAMGLTANLKQHKACSSGSSLLLLLLLKRASSCIPKHQVSYNPSWVMLISVVTRTTNLLSTTLNLVPKERRKEKKRLKWYNFTKHQFTQPLHAVSSIVWVKHKKEGKNSGHIKKSKRLIIDIPFQDHRIHTFIYYIKPHLWTIPAAGINSVYFAGFKLYSLGGSSKIEMWQTCTTA